MAAADSQKFSSLAAKPRGVRIAFTLAWACLGALACMALNTPLPWMIGPLLATAVAGIGGVPLAAAAPLRLAGLWTIGTSLGLYFTPYVVATVAANAGSVIVGVAWALLMGVSFAAFLWRTNPQIAGLDRASTFFSSALGGAAEMIAMAERHGGRADLVASAHSVRLMIVMLTIPFGLQWAGLHGADAFVPGPRDVHPVGLALLAALTATAAALMRRWHVPNPWVLGPLAAAAAITAGGIELSAMPPSLSKAGQLCIGVSLGIRFTPAFIHTATRWLGTVAIGTVGVIAANAGFALLLAQAVGLFPATDLLGTAPGGMAEMTLTAKALQLGVPLVTAFHVARTVAVMLLAAPLYRLCQRLGGAG